MTYYVIGLMSGSSLDGLDIAYAQITYTGGKWEYEMPHATCIPYDEAFKAQLRQAHKAPATDLFYLDTSFARYCAEQVNQFIEQFDLHHKVFFIASHGHTVWHDPQRHTTVQIGDGATIAALTGYTTISDLRNMDVALGGQGAPIVPVTDQLLFPDYSFCLNIGGIANLTVNGKNPVAFDICPANQILDFFAGKMGQPFDRNGQGAASGKVVDAVYHQLNQLAYYRQPAPKSLANNFFPAEILPLLTTLSAEDALATASAHIAAQISSALAPYCPAGADHKMLITGGGALNRHLVAQINMRLQQDGLPVTCIIPDETLIQYKEALAMAMMGVLRWREEENVLASVTGATRNSAGGALWLGA